MKSNTPFLTRIGAFDVDLAVEVGGWKGLRGVHAALGCAFFGVQSCSPLMLTSPSRWMAWTRLRA